MFTKPQLQHLWLLEKLYHTERLHTDFQQQEVIDFIAWIYTQYGYTYNLPKAVHCNTPEKLGAANDSILRSAREAGC